MKAHPAAAIFPLMASDELSRLAADIKANGLHEPIVTMDDAILDGRNRLAACDIAAVKPRFTAYTGKDPLGYVVSKNLHRRHLNESQRGMVAARMATMEHGEIGGGHDRQSGKSAGLVSQSEAAKLLNVGERTVRDAKAILRDAPEKAAAVESGKKTICQTRREIFRAKTVEAAPLPTEKFRVVYADPPWKYGDQLTEDYGPTRFHYPDMSIAELCALPVGELAQKDAVLFLWVTSPILEEAFTVIRAWGFKYKASFIWDKIKHNMGHYNSVRHELLLICVRGSCQPDVMKLFDSVQSIERTKHSAKPEVFREIIDTIYPHGKRVELFARQEAPKGWETWGNESHV